MKTTLPLKSPGDNSLFVADKSLDYSLAYRIAVVFGTCSNFDSPNAYNPSKNYEYANNPGMYLCSSSKKRQILTDKSVPLFCEFSRSTEGLSNCIFYEPDFNIISKVSYLDKYYYLTKFRNSSGSYLFKVYDSEGCIYLDLDYKDIVISDVSDFDNQINDLFYNYLSKDLMISNFEQGEISQDCFTSVQKETKSFLQTILS